MERLQGIAVSPGIAIGEALVHDNEGFRIPRRFLPRDAVDEELERLNRAFDAAIAEVEHNRQRVADQPIGWTLTWFLGQEKFQTNEAVTDKENPMPAP